MSDASGRARHYLNGLQGEPCLPDEFYFALLDHGDTPEADAAAKVVAFHRDVGNGGLAQASSNSGGRDVLEMLDRLGLRTRPFGVVVEDALSLLRSLPEEPGGSSDAWARYEAAHDAAEPEWAVLDERYRQATNPVIPGDDLLEAAVLAYASANPGAFASAAAAASS